MDTKIIALLNDSEKRDFLAQFTGDELNQLISSANFESPNVQTWIKHKICEQELHFTRVKDGAIWHGLYTCGRIFKWSFPACYIEPIQNDDNLEVLLDMLKKMGGYDIDSFCKGRQSAGIPCQFLRRVITKDDLSDNQFNEYRVVAMLNAK